MGSAEEQLPFSQHVGALVGQGCWWFFPPMITVL